MSAGSFAERVERHRHLLTKRGHPLSAESLPSEGQAWEWFHDLNPQVPESARAVARQLARLMGHESEMQLTWRALADAVGRADKAGRPMSYVQTGTDSLKRLGWLDVETSGKGRASKTLWRILPGDSVNDGAWFDSLRDSEMYEDQRAA